MRRLVLGAFYRSLILYYFTTLLAAEAVTKVEVYCIELKLVRTKLLVPNSIKSKVLSNVMMGFFQPVGYLVVQ